jgi:hypothetical protein
LRSKQLNCDQKGYHNLHALTLSRAAAWLTIDGTRIGGDLQRLMSALRGAIPAAIAGVYTVIEAIVMRNVVIRIAMWASVGLLVSVGWGFYFANANKSIPIEPIVYTLARLSQPAAAVVLYLNPTSRLGLTWVAVANAATYALLGLIATTIPKTPSGAPHFKLTHYPFVCRHCSEVSASSGPAQ